MHPPLRITYRHTTPSPSLEAEFAESARKLGTLQPHITACRVLVDRQDRRPSSDRFEVRVEIAMPKTELITSRAEAEDVLVAVREAFDAVVRQLESLARKERRVLRAQAV